MRRTTAWLPILAMLVAFANSATADQRQPQPFPTPGPRPAPEKPAPPPPPAPPATAPTAAREAPEHTPTEATLGVPIYPNARFLASYEAGRGQRFYLFGTNTAFADIVTYYRNVLKEKGELVFDAPATHMFAVGKFKEETMDFEPGVTVKDYTWGGSLGYLNPKPGAQPPRFRTVIQFVPSPAGP